MNKIKFFKTSLYFTGIVTIAIWSLLVWDHYHEGVPSHHILHREDLPAISNWWGGLLLPLLTLFLLYRIQKRLMPDDAEKPKMAIRPATILFGFTGALFFGILLSVFFTFGYSDISGYMVIGVFLLGLFYPIYRAESMLGFVIGMTFTFGVVLPTVVGCLLILVGAILYLFVRPAILYTTSRLVHILPINKHKVDR